MAPPVIDGALSPPVHADSDEEQALRTASAVLERRDRRRWRIGEAQAAEVLNGLVTNDVTRLTAGKGCYAAALTPKGKVIADLRLFATGSDFLLDTTEAAGDGWANVLRKYVNPRLARYEEITANTCDIAVAGAEAARAVASVTGLDAASLESLEAHSHLALGDPHQASIVVRTAEVGVPAFDVITSRENAAALLESLLESGASGISANTWEVARVAHGWPRWGIDMDENTLAQEASLDRFGAISYDKGCYTGQETVARVHFRGHVNRYLRRARFDGGDAIPRGAQLHDGGKPVGDVRSTAISAAEDGVAIVMVRREVSESAVLKAQWDDVAAEVHVRGD
jgi:tRNA-modifying protein YgfZ